AFGAGPRPSPSGPGSRPLLPNAASTPAGPTRPFTHAARNTRRFIVAPCLRRRVTPGRRPAVLTACRPLDRGNPPGPTIGPQPDTEALVGFRPRCWASARDTAADEVRSSPRRPGEGFALSPGLVFLLGSGLRRRASAQKRLTSSSHFGPRRGIKRPLFRLRMSAP